MAENMSELSSHPLLPYALSIEQIKKYLPHRAPFLLVDRILSIEPRGDLKSLAFDSTKIGTRVIGRKNITYNEPCFQGHFPEFSIYPGVMIVETMAQVSCFALYPFLEKSRAQNATDFQVILIGVDGARFRRPVVPGDTLEVTSTVTKCRGKLWAFTVDVTVDGQKVAEAELLANLVLKGQTT